MVKLADARKRSTALTLEDFIGTHVLDKYERLVFLREHPTENRHVHVIGTRLVLDGLAYDFLATLAQPSWGGRKRLEHVRIGSLVPTILESRLSADYFCVDGPFVVTIYNRWDVVEYEHIGKYGNPNSIKMLDAQLLFATCDNIEGRVLFELGDEIHSNPWFVEYVSRWHPEGVMPDYFTRRDPDEPEPVEIARPAKAYEPSRHGSRRKKWR